MADGSKMVIVTAPPAPAAAASKPRRTLGTKIKEALEKKKDALKRANEKAKEGGLWHAAGAFAGPVAVGLGQRFAADAAERATKADPKTAEGAAAIAEARESARIPHIKILGEQGTVGILTAAAGLAFRKPTMLVAGTAQMGAEVALRVAGKGTFDRRAAKLRSAPDSVSGDGDGAELPQTTAGIEGTGDNEVGAIDMSAMGRNQRQAQQPMALPPGVTPEFLQWAAQMYAQQQQQVQQAAVPVVAQAVAGDLSGLDDATLDDVANGRV